MMLSYFNVLYFEQTRVSPALKCFLINYENQEIVYLESNKVLSDFFILKTFFAFPCWSYRIGKPHVFHIKLIYVLSNQLVLNNLLLV